MTATVIRMRRREPRDGWISPIDLRAQVIERCVEQIARAVGGRLTLEQRISLTQCLEDLLDDAPRRREALDPWR
jgi:hypothetical protein